MREREGVAPFEPRERERGFEELCEGDEDVAFESPGAERCWEDETEDLVVVFEDEVEVEVEDVGVGVGSVFVGDCGCGCDCRVEDDADCCAEGEAAFGGCGERTAVMMGSRMGMTVTVKRTKPI